MVWERSTAGLTRRGWSQRCRSLHGHPGSSPRPVGDWRVPHAGVAVTKPPALSWVCSLGEEGKKSRILPFPRALLCLSLGRSLCCGDGCHGPSPGCERAQVPTVLLGRDVYGLHAGSLPTQTRSVHPCHQDGAEQSPRVPLGAALGSRTRGARGDGVPRAGATGAPHLTLSPGRGLVL